MKDACIAQGGFSAMENFDRVVIGAGIYGLYAARCSAKLGQSVLVIEYEQAPFMRASYINQARLHKGYHYPRSYSTALNTAKYFDRFAADYKEGINSEFEQIYAISAANSLTDRRQFEHFCASAGIRCDSIDPGRYFRAGACDGAYLTSEYAFDADVLRDRIVNEMADMPGVQIRYNTRVKSIERRGDEYVVETVNVGAVSSDAETVVDAPLHVPRVSQSDAFSTKFVINATYSSINQIQKIAGHSMFDIKYELCEIILCKVSDNLKNKGITVMDGPFFSIMPFGKSNLHALSSVKFTPHLTSYDNLAEFDCQAKSDGYCTPESLGNCNNCPAKPESAWQFMSALVKQYLKPEFKIEYVDSLYSIKPILKSSEVDDSRPTVIMKCSENPTFISVLSGKINTIYDMDEVLGIL